jgi:hypothetical protein
MPEEKVTILKRHLLDKVPERAAKALGRLQRKTTHGSSQCTNDRWVKDALSDDRTLPIFGRW